MSTESTRVERIRPYGERAARVAVPVGTAVVTWLVVLLAVGTVARLDSLSVLNLLPLFVIAVMFWPIYLAAPWRPGLTDRLSRTVLANRWAVFFAGGLFVVRLLPFTPDFILALLDIPFRSAGVLFGAGLFYRRLLSPTAGQVVLWFGQWYLEAFYLLVLGSLFETMVGWVRW